MRSSDPCGCDERRCRASTENCSSTEGNKGSSLLRTAEAKPHFKKTSREIWLARGGPPRNRTHGQRGVGTADCRCSDGRDSLPAKRRPLFYSGFQHETFYDRAGAGEAWAGI